MKNLIFGLMILFSSVSLYAGSKPGTGGEVSKIHCPNINDKRDSGSEQQANEDSNESANNFTKTV